MVAVVKKNLVGFLAILSCMVNTSVSKGFLDDDAFRNHILETAQMVLDNTTWETAWEETLSNSKHDQDLGLTYTCQFSPSPKVPTSVHELRPGDIKFVAALGGSVTSGFALGATHVSGILVEQRGEAWSAGGDGILHDEHIETDEIYEETGRVTIPNILKQFNPDIRGYSTESGSVDSKDSRLNQAWSGAMAKDLPGQADDLIKKMKEMTDKNEEANFEDDWKLLTVFIGLHDTCNACNDPVEFSKDNYITHVRSALDKLATVPRMLVSIVPVYNMQYLSRLTDNVFCEDLIGLMCPCALTTQGQEFIRTTQLEYSQALEELVNSHDYNNQSDFTVVLQPHLTDLGFPVDVPAPNSTHEVNKTFVGADCFNPNYRGHRMLAYMLWNTMLTPVENKTTRYPYTEELELFCPNERYPYIFTYNNSIGSDGFHGGGTNNDKGFLDDDDFRSHILETAQKVLNDTKWKTAWEEVLSNSKHDQDLKLTYTCQLSPSTTVPTSVHELRPGDINFVAALGGSVTSGFALGAEYVSEIMVEERGEAWSAGGDGILHQQQIKTDGKADYPYEETGRVTIPNILKQFNADILGYSTDSGSVDSPNAHLNRAWSGAMAKDLPGQVDDLISKMKSNGYMNYNFHWKLLTVFIGLHDTCNACNNPGAFSKENYTTYVRNALDKLATVPRMLVSLVPVYNMQYLGRLIDNIFCKDLIGLMCPCALTTQGQESIRATQMEYNEALKELVNSHEYNQEAGFTVVLQPHLTNLGFPVDVPVSSDPTEEVNKTFVGADCFNPSYRGHRMLAYMLWNTMLTPVDKKETRYPYTEELNLFCPSGTYPYIFTYNNSIGTDWGKGGGAGKNKGEDDSMEIALITTVSILALVLVLAMIAGILVSSFCKKKSKETKESLVFKRSDTSQLPITYMTYENPEDVVDETGLGAGPRRESHDSNASYYLPGSRRGSADFVITTSPTGSRRSSLEPSAAQMVPTSQLSRPGLYVRRGSEDLRRDILRHNFQDKRRQSEGSLQVPSHFGNDRMTSNSLPFQFAPGRDMLSVAQERSPPTSPSTSPKRVNFHLPNETTPDISTPHEDADEGAAQSISPGASNKGHFKRASMEKLDEVVMEAEA